MQNDHAPVINVSNLTTSFYAQGEWKAAIKDISFTIPSGKIIGLVGESGSGKSVSSLSITKLLPTVTSRIESGTILFNGTVSLTNLSEKEMRVYRTNKIAMIFQDPMSALNPVERCGNQVIEPLRLHKNLSKKKARERVIQLFKEVELPDPEQAFNKYPFELSGGQKQRVMIAIAMSCDPDILIADEPTTALDPEVSQSILRLINKLQNNNGMGVLFITHDLELLSGFADEILVMYKGEIVERGPSEIILSHPSHLYTKALIGCKPPKDKKPKRLPTIEDFINIENFQLELVTEKERSKRHQTIYSKDPMVRVKDLSVHFQIKGGLLQKTISTIKAVDCISFELFQGETLGLIGPSGCGKTTLGRALLRLVEPTLGEVYFKENDILQFNDRDFSKLRKDIQIIFQDPFSSLNPRIKIGNAIAEPLIIHEKLSREEAEEEVLKMLEIVGLEKNHYYRYPHEFSGGQRQRIGIARALILKPDLIVCDESVSALDVSVQAQILNLLNDLKDEFGLTYLFISHDMDVVRYFSDRVMVMESGKLTKIGKSEEILGNH